MKTEEDEQNIALYIDELKSDDNSLKINAIQKMELICSNLSQKRIDTEFFPYLQYIVEELDNEDDFIIEMAVQIKSFVEKHPQTNQGVVLQVMEACLMIDDSLIRKKAIEVVTFCARQNLSSVIEVIKSLYSKNKIGPKLAILEILDSLQRNTEFKLSQDQLRTIDSILMEYLQDRVLQIKRFAIRSLIFYLLNHNKYQQLQILSKKTLEEIVGYYSKQIPEGLRSEILSNPFVNALFQIIDADQKQVILNKAFESLKDEKEQWRIKYLILENKTLMALHNKSIIFIYEILEKTFKHPEQEIKSATVRAIRFLLEQVDSIEKMQEFWSIFEDMIKNELMPSQDVFLKKNTIDLLIGLLHKVKFGENYAIESFVMYLEYFTFQDHFNDAKQHSMLYLQHFLQLMGGSLDQKYNKDILKPFKKTELVNEEPKPEDHKMIHKNLKEEILAPKKTKKDEVLVFEDEGKIKADILLRLNHVINKANWKLRLSLLEKIEALSQKLVTEGNKSKNKDLISFLY